MSTLEIVSPHISQSSVVSAHFEMYIEVVARDAHGEPVPGAKITFSVPQGGGSLKSSELVTNESGRVANLFVPEQGANVFEIDASGLREPVRFAFSAVARYRLEFERDSVVLSGPGCWTEMFAKVFDRGYRSSGAFVDFTMTNEDVIRLYPVTGTASFRHMTAGVYATQPGTTKLIATLGDGADTAVVRVGNAIPTMVMPDLVIATGGIAYPHVSMAISCNGSRMRAFFFQSPPTVSSLAPEIVEASGGTEKDGTIKVTGLKRGIALVEARGYGVADTARVDVRDVALEPGDTTIRVGDTIPYRFLVSDTAGALAPAAAVWTHTDGTVAQMQDAGVYRAVSAGADTIKASTRAVQGSQRTAVLRVVQP